MKKSSKRKNEVTENGCDSDSENDIDIELNVSKDKDDVKGKAMPTKKKKYYCIFNDNWLKEDEFQNWLMKKNMFE